MATEHESEPQGYPAWQWILATLFFLPLIPMLIAIVAPGTRAALTPKRIWAGYVLFVLVGFVALVVLVAIFAPPPEEKAEPADQVPQPVNRYVIEPTATPKPVVVPTWTPTAGLGVTRRLIQVMFQDPKRHAFVFDNLKYRDDGTPFVMGRSSDKSGMISLIGPEDDVVEIQYLFMGGMVSPDSTLVHVVNMNTLIMMTFPEWQSTDIWLSDGLKLLMSNPSQDEISNHRDGKEATLSLSRSAGMLVLVIKPDEGSR